MPTKVQRQILPFKTMTRKLPIGQHSLRQFSLRQFHMLQLPVDKSFRKRVMVKEGVKEGVGGYSRENCPGDPMNSLQNDTTCHLSQQLHYVLTKLLRFDHCPDNWSWSIVSTKISRNLIYTTIKRTSYIFRNPFSHRLHLNPNTSENVDPVMDPSVLSFHVIDSTSNLILNLQFLSHFVFPSDDSLSLPFVHTTKWMQTEASHLWPDRALNSIPIFFSNWTYSPAKKMCPISFKTQPHLLPPLC